MERRKGDVRGRKRIGFLNLNVHNFVERAGNQTDDRKYNRRKRKRKEGREKGRVMVTVMNVVMVVVDEEEKE